MESKKDLAVLWFKRALAMEPSNENLLKELRAAESGQPSPAAEPEAEKGFWAQGIFGLLGARTVWWGMVIAQVVFVLNSLFGVGQGGRVNKALFDDAGPAVGFFSGLIGGAFCYVLWWGFPVGAWWIMLAVYSLLMAGGTAAVAAAD